MAELVAGAFLGSFLNVLFERIATPEFLLLFKTRKMDMGLLQELKILVNTVNKVLDDAEIKQITNPIVKNWSDDLRDAAYEADDILDFIAYEAATASKDEADLTTGNQIRDLFTCCSPFKKASWRDHSGEAFSLRDVPKKMEGIVKRIQLLVQQIDPIGLRQGAGKEASKEAYKERETSSLVDESLIFGREADTEAILKLLQEDDADCNGIGVIPIVGIGGMGKTTLAQLIFKHDRVAELFECRAWVCVSDNYDGVRIRKDILKGVNGSSSVATCGSSLQEVDVELEQSLKNKKYLLVLDDIWDNAWENLLKPLKSGARGSKILFTTRDQRIASKMGTIGSPHDLPKLDDDICWKIFEKHVFKGGERNQRLESIGRKIARKCSGLPLAATMLGGLLRGNYDEADWVEISDSKTWEFDGDKVLPALRLSYQHLPSHLKQCFAYCAIFPKDYEIKKEELIRLWMAEGFLVPPKSEIKAERWGEKCFQELVSRSFFQKYSGGSYFLMHDLINDVAQLVSGDFSMRIDEGDSSEFNSRNRYFSFSLCNASILKTIENIHKANFLRTFYYLDVRHVRFYQQDGNYDQVVNKLVSRLRCVRVLSLCAFSRMTKLPDSIEHLKHLRYLNLAETDLERLPETVCTLYNLQFLILTYCMKLVELPENMGKLINLHCLDIRGTTKLEKMPPGMGDLKHLVILSYFILGKQSGSDLNELGKLQHLQGALSVSNLQNVVNIPKDILKNKRELEDLELNWSGGGDNSAHELSVLEQLQPYASIKKLSIRGYGGTKFADWVGLSSYANLVSLGLHGCENCISLPPLGSLSNLEDLRISKFDKIVEVFMEMPFKSLKTLLIRDMEQWEKWLFCEENNPEKCGSLVKLKSLRIENCPKLKTTLTSGPTHMVFYSLNTLIVVDCPNLKIYNLIAISKLPHPLEFERQFYFRIRYESIVSLELLPSARSNLNIGTHTTEGIEEMGDALNVLEDVRIRDSELCECIPLEVFPALKSLLVERCCNLKYFSASCLPLPQPLTSLTYLNICDCESLMFFPKGGISAPNLISFELERCENLKSLPEGMNVLLPSLKLLKIEYCPNLESFPEGGLPAKLQSLDIQCCEKLESFQEEDFPPNLQSLKIDIIEKLIGRRLQLGFQRFNALSHLILGPYFKDDLGSFPEESLLPSTLTSLTIEEFKNLEVINHEGLRHLTSLSELKIGWCPKLRCLPEGLPSSLSVLKIKRCDLLKERCERGKGQDWPKIAHISTIEIDYQTI